MSDLITKQRILGKQYTLLGDGRDDIILNGAGNVKVRFGNSFIDLLKDGRIASSSSTINNTIITKVESKSSIPESDGWYFALDTGMLYYKINGELYLVISEKENSNDIGSFVSFTDLQGLSMEQILIAQTNIKNIIDDTTNLLTLPNGLAFFDITRSRHYINYDGILTEIYLSLAHGGIVRNSVTITNNKDSAGGPELFNIVGGNLNINNNGNNLTLSLDELNSIIKSSTENLILSNSSGNVVYINKTVGIGTQPRDEYTFTVAGDIYTENRGILDSGIQSSDYRENYTGYSLHKTYLDGWVLEVDKLIVRNSKSENIKLVGYTNNTYISQSGIVDYIEEVYPTDENGDTTEDSEPSSYIINLTNIYDIAVGDILEFDVKSPYHFVLEEVTDEDGYTDTQEVLYNEVVTLRRGLFAVTSVDYDVQGDKYFCIVEGTLSDNVINTEATIPEIGDVMVKVNNETNLYINSVNHEPYIKATSTENGDLTILGNLNNLVFNDTTYTNKDVGIYTNRLLGDTGILLDLTVENSLTSNGDTLLHNTIIDGNLNVKGDIIQEGNAYITHAETLEVENHLIIVNKGPNPSPTLSSNYSGIQVDRQLQPASDNKDYLFIFDESDDRFKIGKLNSLQYVATRDSEGNLVNNSILIWDSSNKYIKSSLAKFVNGALLLTPTHADYCEGLRIGTKSDWSTILLGSTSDSGTSENAWGIFRKDNYDFSISRNSSDGLNGLVITKSGYIGLGTIYPSAKLHINGTLKIENQGNILQIGNLDTAYTHFNNSLNKPFHFNNTIYVKGDIYGTDSYNSRLAYVDEISNMSVLESNRLTNRVTNLPGIDLNIVLSGGGAAYNYGSAQWWINGPNNMDYGSVFQFNSTGADQLSLQIATDINHNVDTSTKKLWFRTSNNLGFHNDWKEIYHSGNANNISSSWSVSTLTASGWIYTGTGWCNNTFNGGMFMNDVDNVKVYGDKILYNDGSRTYGINNHRVGLRLYGANHIGINLVNNNCTWGIYSNSNGGMYIGKRLGFGNSNNEDKYIAVLQDIGLTLYGSENTFTTISGYIGSDVHTVISRYTVQWYDESWQWDYYRGGSNDLQDIRLSLNGTRKLNIDRQGNITAAGAITPNSASDRRLKTNITHIKSKASNYLKTLNPVEFDWTETALLLNPHSELHGIGFIADEYKQIFPQYVGTIYDEYESINTTPLFAILTKGWQEHDEEIDKLNKEIENLKYEIKLLKFKLHGA